MNINLQRCIAHLNLGVELKSVGDYNGALKEYANARAEFPTYKHIYNNNAKIFFISPTNVDKSLRNFLVYAHLSIIQENIIDENIQFASNNNYYEFSGEYLPNKHIPVGYAYQKVLEKNTLGIIFSDVNLTFNVGFAYLIKYRNIVFCNDIPADIIINQQCLLLGMDYRGAVLADSKYAPMIRNIGFLFLIKNIISNEVSEKDVTNIYLNDLLILDEI